MIARKIYFYSYRKQKHKLLIHLLYIDIKLSMFEKLNPVLGVIFIKRKLHKTNEMVRPTDRLYLSVFVLSIHDRRLKAHAGESFQHIYSAFLVSKFKLSIQTFDPSIQTFNSSIQTFDPSNQIRNCSVQTFDPSIQTFNPSMQIWNGSIQTFHHSI